MFGADVPCPLSEQLIFAVQYETVLSTGNRVVRRYRRVAVVEHAREQERAVVGHDPVASAVNPVAVGRLLRADVDQARNGTIY